MLKLIFKIIITTVSALIISLNSFSGGHAEAVKESYNDIVRKNTSNNINAVTVWQILNKRFKIERIELVKNEYYFKLQNEIYREKNDSKALLNLHILESMYEKDLPNINKVYENCVKTSAGASSAYFEKKNGFVNFVVNYCKVGDSIETWFYPIPIDQAKSKYSIEGIKKVTSSRIEDDVNTIIFIKSIKYNKFMAIIYNVDERFVGKIDDPRMTSPEYWEIQMTLNT